MKIYHKKDVLSVLELIKTRRTVYQFNAKEVDDKTVNQSLEAAIWAPNHKLVQPWRFFVIGPETQIELAKIYAFLRASKKCEPETEAFKKAYHRAQTKFLNIPKIVFVAQILSEDRIETKENYAACACAIQNFQLMAHALDLGVQWSTGPIISQDKTRELLHISQNNVEIIGALYMGYYDKLGSSSRKPIEQVTAYLL